MYTQGHTARFTHFYASRDGTSKSGPSGEQNLYDKVVDAAGGGDSTSIQTGLDSAGDSSTVLVKSGSYTENINSTNTNVKVVVEPGTTVTGTVTLTGDCNTWQMGAGGTVTGLITLTGDKCSYLGKNGGALSGVQIDGASCYFTGGGWGTLTDGGTTVRGILMNSVSADSIVTCFSSQTTTGGTGFDAVVINSSRSVCSIAKINDSEEEAIDMGAAATDILVLGVTALESDVNAFNIQSERTRCIGNRMTISGGGSAQRGILMGTSGAGDNSIVGACVIDQTTGADSIEINANTENCVVVGNRLNGAVDDKSGTSTVADNELTAF